MASIMASGTGRLAGGRASVTLEMTFRDAISEDVPLKVIVTPTSMCNGMCVTERSASGFSVAELADVAIVTSIDLYRAGLHMKELSPLLLDMVRHYAVPSGRFQEIYDAVNSQLFGHLTGGSDRQGRDFLTVYFGEKGSSDTVAGGP